MKQIHFTSGIVITLFISLHLFNHIYSLVGIKEHLLLMDQLRVIYRNVFAETILLTAVSVQVISGYKMFLSKNKTATTFFEKLQLWSGIYLAIFFIFHLGAVFTGRLFLNLDTNIFFGVAGLNTFPFNLFFVPYYGLAIVSFFGHLSAVHSIKMKRSLMGIRPHKQSIFILACGVLLTLSILYGLTNRFAGVNIPEEYNILIGK